ncbi:MAG TPA: cell division protein FtsH, partial [Verrucomicrobia bacterium]|nr:cell division protein FtsH [Verrucomicrobiota bacterium]
MKVKNMSESNNSNEKKSGEVKVPPKTWIVWIIILAFIPLLMLLKDSSKPKFEKIDYNRLMELVKNDQIIEGVINYDPQNPLRE